jgi:hypothetical protein
MKRASTVEVSRRKKRFLAESTSSRHLVAKGPTGKDNYEFTHGSCGSGNYYVIFPYNVLFGYVDAPDIFDGASVHLTPLTISDWKVSSDEALKVALNNGGQNMGSFFAEELKEDYNQLVWDVKFGSMNEGFVFTIDAKTGNLLNKHPYIFGLG